MEIGSMISTILRNLTEQLDESNSVVINFWDSIIKRQCRLYEGLTDTRINKLEENKVIRLPEDVRKFYKQSNGLDLFTDKYGSGIYIHSLEKLPQCIINYEQFYPIAEYRDLGFIAIKKDISLQPFTNYIFYIDQNLSDPPIALNTNFELWLKRIIQAQGNPYWEWDIYTAENLYNKVR